MSDNPFTFGEARTAAHQASLRQVESERARRDAAEDAAAKELTYRRLLSQRIVTLHAEGVAWTAAGDIARGDDDVSTARYQRDVAAGVLGAQEAAQYRLQADRRVLERLVDWSMRRELAAPGVGG